MARLRLQGKLTIILCIFVHHFFLLAPDDWTVLGPTTGHGAPHVKKMITTFQVFLRTRDPHGRPQKSLRRRQELEIIKGRMYRVRRSVGVRWSMVWGGTLSACSMWVWDYAPEINSNVNVEIVRFLAFYKGKTDDDINFQHSRGLGTATAPLAPDWRRPWRSHLLDCFRYPRTTPSPIQWTSHHTSSINQPCGSLFTMGHTLFILQSIWKWHTFVIRGRE